jgi:hypothetical protein
VKPAHLALAFAACSHSSPAAPDAANLGDAASGERTLANCGGSVGSDVPEPYASLFSCANVSLSGSDLVISTTALPPHQSYYWGSASPNYEAWDDRGGAYHANPNTLVESDTKYTIPLAPTSRNLTIDSTLVDGVANTSTYEYRLGPAGEALDGVLLFNALAAPGDDISTEVYTFDEWNAHPAPTGEYHYHGASPGPLAALAAGGKYAAGIEVYGMMCDGTFLLGCTELDGSVPDQTDLDAQNGHVHDVVDGNGATVTARYHVHVCTSWTAHPRPYTPEIQYYAQCIVQ